MPMHTIREITRLATMLAGLIAPRLYLYYALASISCEHYRSSRNNPHCAPRHVIYNRVQTGEKSRIACLRVERHAANCASATQSGEMFILPAPTGENILTTRFNGWNVHTARFNGENFYTAWHMTARGTRTQCDFLNQFGHKT